jgi:uncharacterized membrane protein YdcZ (DUF606 family)
VHRRDIRRRRRSGLALAFTRQPQLNLAGLKDMPWWGWVGGFRGAIYVTTMFSAIPAIGVAAVVVLTVAGQQAASVLIDRNGWLLTAMAGSACLVPSQGFV